MPRKSGHGFVLVAPQVIVAAGCAGLAVFYFQNAFAFGDAGVEPPVEWQIVFGAVMGVIVVTGFGLGFAYGRFNFSWLLDQCHVRSSKQSTMSTKIGYDLGADSLPSDFKSRNL